MFRILNIDQARFDCTYGRGCAGVCCREGRPLIYPEEKERIDANLERFLPAMRLEARAAVGRRGYLRLRRRLGQRVLRGAGGWCVFYNQGCVLHRAGEKEGDRFRYKPAVCTLFPIQTDARDRWYVRQKGYQGERWGLFCLDSQSTGVPAAVSLREEIALARRFDEDSEKPAVG
jgi:hypothetical protein